MTTCTKAPIENDSSSFSSSLSLFSISSSPFSLSLFSSSPSPLDESLRFFLDAIFSFGWNLVRATHQRIGKVEKWIFDGCFVVNKKLMTIYIRSIPKWWMELSPKNIFSQSDDVTNLISMETTREILLSFICFFFKYTRLRYSTILKRLSGNSFWPTHPCLRFWISKWCKINYHNWNPILFITKKNWCRKKQVDFPSDGKVWTSLFCFPIT